MGICRKAANSENVWMIKPAAQPTVQVIAKQDRFAQKVVMLCVWWNFEGIINHFELVQNGAVDAAALYSEQLDNVYAALAVRYPALINRKHAHFYNMTILRVHILLLSSKEKSRSCSVENGCREFLEYKAAV